MTTNKTRVGFIGLGTMGSPMASNIANSNEFDLALYDVDPAVAQALSERLGATAVTDVAALADRDIIVTMLPTSVIVRAVLLDGDAPRIPAAPGTVFVDMSSSDPTDTIETGRLLAQAGFAMVDAPVSGAKERATTGTLTIMMGADDDVAAQRAVPVIETMSSQIVRTGKLGSGHAMKALNNFVAAAAFTASSEAIIAGAEFGLTPEVMTDVFNSSTGQSFVTTHVLPDHIVGEQYASGFALPLFTKDVRIAQKVQQASGHASPVCDAVVGAMSDALSALGDVDHTLAITHWQKR